MKLLLVLVIPLIELQLVSGQDGTGQIKDCQPELAAYAQCISNGRQTQRWILNRPYSNHAAVDQCFSE